MSSTRQYGGFLYAAQWLYLRRRYKSKWNILRLNVLSASEWRTWLRKFETASSQKFIVKRNYFRHYVFTTLKLSHRPKCKSTLVRVDGTSRSAISSSDDFLVLLVLKAQLTVHPAWLSNSQTKLLLHYGVWLQ